MKLEQYLEKNNSYDINIIIQLLEEQGEFFAMSFSQFPKATEYLSEIIQGNKCLLIFTSEKIAKNVGYKNWHIAKYKLSELEKLLIASKCDSICINYGCNWCVLQLKKENTP